VLNDMQVSLVTADICQTQTWIHPARRVQHRITGMKGKLIILVSMDDKNINLRKVTRERRDTRSH